jgi:dolichol-phosphate mannosyltransferase
MTNQKEIKKPVSMVMVAYTEQNNKEMVIREYYSKIYLKLPKGSEFIIYLDAPPDNTPKIVKSLAKKINIKVIEGKKNLGYAGAMTAALKATKNNIIFYSDSSGKHRAEDFWKMIKFESQYDIINGLRVSKGNPIIRQIVTFVQRLIVSVLFVMPLYDFNTGYKIIHRNIINNVLKKCKYMKQSFSSELLIRAYKKGYTIKDVPVAFKKRQGKNTGTNYGQLPGIILKSLKGFLLLRLELWRKS